MRYLALACDYDGTLAHDGRVSKTTLAGLERFLASGRKLIMVTGRELPDLQTTFDHFDLFEWIVAENGALLYKPATRETFLLAEPPPARFAEVLQERGVGPISVGGVIVATWEPHENTVLEVIRDLGLELQVIFNKGAVMVLPGNINKATGLTAALERMGLSPHNVVGVGDAENDHAFLTMCECSAAVSNAIPSLKQTADLVLAADHGDGVVLLIDEMIQQDLRERQPALMRRDLLVGPRRDKSLERIAAYGSSVLIAGPSGSGKSTVATALLERILEQKYQFCIIDPEGDYEGSVGAVMLGNRERGPAVEEVLQVLRKPSESVIVNMVGLRIADRPNFFLSLLPRLLELRAAVGRPHWLIIDEAHHLLPSSWQPATQALPQSMGGLVLITVHPEEVSPAVLSLVDTAIAVGPEPHETLGELCRVLGEHAPAEVTDKADEEVLVWKRGQGEPRPVRPELSHGERKRHVRKYAEGVLPPDRSFYFRGPESKLKLRAQNLMNFLELGDGVDDDTWNFHLREGAYSRWFLEAIKDPDLSVEVAAIEENETLTAAESRAEVRVAVEKRFTLPASSRLPMPGTDEAPKFEQAPTVAKAK